MHSAKLTIALIISVTCGLVTAQFGAVSYNNFSCPNKPHVEGHCVWTRYKKPNVPKSGVDYYNLDPAVKMKPGTWNCGVNLALCCSVNDSAMSADSKWMWDEIGRLCETPRYA
ncbi:hypothetical protein PGT21_022306 [Puccinia graminis f. sp. tritici]|uniref:Uncharacterized protein n=1 Tax=Puccinia graminis f. sp. tritici TaxID=56615 RepID=A0A5B0RGL3_PUCGR|nr:hypothetical protein PGT21_022306 [Puccinia graminis f. sp. tritici]KAA1124073.1 hypothetical protein PGTUg99_025615 [Puccinia graminis f. sp. tritici]